MFYKPRFLHRLWAFARGYSWIPCPVCKRRFGTHEWAVGNELWITERDSVAVCPRCAAEAGRINRENGYPRVVPPAPLKASE
jgi:hypothetical protein